MQGVQGVTKRRGPSRFPISPGLFFLCIKQIALPKTRSAARPTLSILQGPGAPRQLRAATQGLQWPLSCRRSRSREANFRRRSPWAQRRAGKSFVSLGNPHSTLHILRSRLTTRTPLTSVSRDCPRSPSCPPHCRRRRCRRPHQPRHHQCEFVCLPRRGDFWLPAWHITRRLRSPEASEMPRVGRHSR